MLTLINEVREEVDWQPDIMFYDCITKMELDKEIFDSGEKFFENIEKLNNQECPAVESESLSKRHIVARLMSDCYWPDYEKSKEWDRKYRGLV